MRMFSTELIKVPRLIYVAGRKFILHPGEAILLCRMAWWISFLSASARWCSLPKTLALVSGRESHGSERPDNEVAKHLARSIDLLLSANFLYFKPICWKRAAVLRRYLSRNGIATRILFGVKGEAEGKVTGHAWLQSNGQPILESSPPDYVITYSFPSEDNMAAPTIASFEQLRAQSKERS